MDTLVYVCTKNTCAPSFERATHQLIRVFALDTAVIQTVLRTGRPVQVQDDVKTGVPESIIRNGNQRYTRQTNTARREDQSQRTSWHFLAKI